MPPKPTLYLAPSGADAGVLAAGIAGLCEGRVEPVRRERRTLLDTFDWRVHRGGLAFEHITSGDGAHLVLRAWGQAPPLATLPTDDGAPRLATELAPGRVREKLAPLLDVRALVAIAAYDVAVHLVVVRNDDDKAVARIAVDDMGAGHVVIRCLPVTGYVRAAKAAVRAVTASRCQEAGIDVSDVALERAGRRAGDRGGKLALAFDGTSSAASGWVTALVALLDEIEANIDGTVADIDSEFLHDLRVAVRRSRSALRHAHDVLPAELLDCFRPALRWLQEITGPARDLDVYVLAAEADLATLDAAARPALEPFQRFLAGRRVEAHERLNADLRSPACEAVLADWRHTLLSLGAPEGGEEAGEWGAWPEQAERNLAEVAAHRIRAEHRKLVRDGEAIEDASPATALHDLRKRGKELRYLLELFGQLLDRRRTDSFVKALKGLQDVLGEFQDTEVQIRALRGWADELAASGNTGAPTVMAMGELVERLQQRQDSAREAFAARFARFAAAERP
ncbi:MAG: CHAD domain-containing protein [Acidimicrobiales bacterium]